MIYPIKYRYFPDSDEGRRLRGQGQRIMTILESIMDAGKIENQTIKFRPYDGSLIVAHKFFGVKVVDIYTSHIPPDVKAIEGLICICNCNFSIGWIFEQQDSTLFLREGTTLLSWAKLYKVMACNQKGNAFVLYENVLASDWTTYEVGQRVAMIPYNSMSYLCCVEKDGSGGPRGCKPIITTSEITTDSWRSTYRIIPLCTENIPLRIEKSRWNPNG